MTTFIALVRGINVGGNNKVAMADLRDLASGAGFDNPRTLLNSGNLVFGARAASPAAIEARLERAAMKSLGLDASFLVRTAAEWRAAIDENPFAKEAAADPGRTVLVCLRDAPSPSAVNALAAAIPGRERLRVLARHAYIVYPDGQGTSRLTNAVIEKQLGTRGTARNWNTVLKLAALAAA